MTHFSYLNFRTSSRLPGLAFGSPRAGGRERVKSLNSRRPDAGFSTLEVLIAMVIIVMALTAVILIIGTNQTTTTDVDINQAALTEAKKQLESAKASASMDFNSVSTPTSYVSDIFTANFAPNNINNCRKELTSTITWLTDPLRPGQVDLTTTVINSAEAEALGGQCGPNPPTTDWVDLVCDDNGTEWDDNPAIEPTGIDIFSRSGKTYGVITSNRSNPGSEDIYIIDTTNKAALTDPLVWSLDMGPGLIDVDVSGNYAFALNHTTTRQLQVFDISNLLAPDYVKSASRSLDAVYGSPGTFNVNSGDHMVRKIFFHNDRLYIGTYYMVSYPEFQIFDVSNPTNPILPATWKFNVNHIINDIYVRNEIIGGVPKTYAYLAISDSDSSKPKLIVLDVTDPSSISQVSSYNPSPQDTLYGTSLHILGNEVYLGRQNGTSTNHDLHVADITKPLPALLQPLDSADLLLNSAGSEVKRIIVSGGLGFIATTDPNNQAFQVWDFDDPQDIQFVTDCNLQQGIVDMQFDGNFFYTVNTQNKRFRVIYDANNPFP